MKLENKIGKILTIAAFLSGSSLVVQDSNAQMASRMSGGVRIGVRPGTEFQMQFNSHQPYGNHINFRGYNNGQNVFNYHVPTMTRMQVGALGTAGMVATAPYSAIYQIRSGQAYLNKNCPPPYGNAWGVMPDMRRCRDVYYNVVDQGRYLNTGGVAP